MKSIKAFTIVELIVVITILAILGTIGFIAFSSHLIGTRDTNRLSQLSSIHQGLEVYSTSNTLPSPENSVEVKASGSLIGYQGYAGKNVLSMIQYSKGGKDPRDEQYYSYYLTEDKKHFQLMGFLEDDTNLQINLISQSYAADYTRRFPTVIGNKLGILTESGTNLPIQEVSTIVSSGYLDVVTTTKDYKANFTDQDSVSGTGIILAQINTNSSCKRILEMGGNKGDGIYKINPVGTEFDVYCDMTTDGGGWTLVGISAGTTNGTGILTNNSLGDFSDISSTSTVKMSTNDINNILFAGNKQLRINPTGTGRWIIEYSNSNNKLDFVTFKSYNISLTDYQNRTSQFFDTHPNFIIFTGISSDTFVSTLCPSGCRQTFSVYNTTTNKLGVVGDLSRSPYIRRSGGNYTKQFIDYKLYVK